MRTALSIGSLIGSLIFGIILKFFPDFPLGQEAFIAFFIWLLAQFGLEIKARIKSENT